MRTKLLVLPLLALNAAFAETEFSIGDETVQLLFKQGGYQEAFRLFVAKDVERVFTPLGNISNVVDIASLQAHPNQCQPLIHHEGFPEHFYGSFSITNANGVFVFLMDETLSEKYQNIYDGFSSTGSRFAALTNLLDTINTGVVTNQVNTSLATLIFVPSNSDIIITEDQARAFFTSLRQEGMMTVSVLDLWNEDVFGEESLMAASKMADEDTMGLNFSPVFWIFRNGMWRFFHPALWRHPSVND